MRASATCAVWRFRITPLLHFLFKTQPVETITILDKICAAEFDFLVLETQRPILETNVSEIEPVETITILDKICTAELHFLVSETHGPIWTEIWSKLRQPKLLQF